MGTFAANAQIAEKLNHAMQFGWMSGVQYSFIADRLLSDPGCSLLVFGLGHDAPLWAECVRQDLAFVEDDPTYLTTAPATTRVVLHTFESRVGKWFEIPEPPRLIERDWDYVIVDGPRGFSTAYPGRQFSIGWAKKMAQKQIFVHDYERQWEREVCDRLLGHPSQQILPTKPKRGVLAVFNIT